MTYSETLEFLYAQLPMFHRIGPAAFKKDLTNTLALLEALGRPQRRFRSIHVGGTNGKGSVSHMLAAVCQAAGLKTGLYVSPHYKDFRERIKVNGRYIPRARVTDFVAKNRASIERIQPSFFELCVAMAFQHFAEQQVDVAVVEVGLGGRLDSTNVILPELSVITNISYDHQNMLGDTLTLIAGEKAGIIKPGVPVVIGETHPESAPVFLEKAAQQKAPIYFADKTFRVYEQQADEPLPALACYNVLKNGQPYLQDLQLEASGPFQQRNLATLLQAREALADSSLRAVCDERHLRDGLARLKQYTRFMGRWEILGRAPLTLVDSAHNEAGLRLAFEQVAAIPHRRLHVVTGFVNDKSVEGVLGLFPASARYYFAKADIPRGLEASILQEKAAVFGLKGQTYRSVRQALGAARRAAQPNDMILVIGSIFVAAEVL